MTPEDIARKYVNAIMCMEDENQGCQKETNVRPLFCCQWNNREPCGECRDAELQTVQIIAAAIREFMAQ